MMRQDFLVFFRCKLISLRFLIFKILLSLFAIVFIWELFSHLTVQNHRLLPSLKSIFLELLALFNSGYLMINIGGSLYRVLLGFITAAILGIFLGTLFAYFPVLGSLFTPIIDMLRPIPPIAWIPLAIFWFGLGNVSAIFIVILGAFFPIFSNTYLGVRSVSINYIDTAQCFGAGKFDIIKDVILPSAAPQILTGIRVGIGTAWTSVIASEMIGARGGLGYAIQLNRIILNSEGVIINMLIIGLIGWLMNRTVTIIEKKLVAWNTPQ